MNAVRPAIDLLRFPAQAESPNAVLWTIVVFLLVLAAAGGVWWVRRKLSPDEDFHGEGFNLADLRRLHMAGQMSDEEFERAKAVILGGLGAPPPKPDEPQIKPDSLPGHRRA